MEEGGGGSKGEGVREWENGVVERAGGEGEVGEKGG